jgi:uncharacterized protein
MPWKNGGGMTTQLAISPPDATLDNFDWRISTAQVKSGGPFSTFPDIERTLSVLEGAGLVLRIDGGTPFTLTVDSMPLPFAGEQAVHAELVDGPILDFNVMTRRERCTHLMQTIRLQGSTQVSLQADLLFIYCVRGSAVHCRSAGGEDIVISAGDTVVMARGDGGHVALSTQGTADTVITQLKFKETVHVQ